jgi:hypothetical protein
MEKVYTCILFLPKIIKSTWLSPNNLKVNLKRNGLISSQGDFGRKSNGLSDVQIISITLEGQSGSFDTKINLKSICLH